MDNSVVFKDNDGKYCVCFSKKIKQKLIELCSRSNPKETGGILIGKYSKDQSTAIITTIIINLKKKYSLNKGPNTKSTTVINYKIKTLDLKDNYRKDNIYNKNTSKINNRYELNYESDIGEKNNKLYEQNKTESNIGNYKYNTIFYSNINHTNNNLKKMNSINNLEKKENSSDVRSIT